MSHPVGATRMVFLFCFLPMPLRVTSFASLAFGGSRFQPRSTPLGRLVGATVPKDSAEKGLTICGASVPAGHFLGLHRRRGRFPR